MKLAAAAGDPPAKYPAKWTPEAIVDWTERCREPFLNRGDDLTVKAFRLWLMRDFERDYVEWLCERIADAIAGA